ncbi:MAG TPA: preprotein translocase subunit SecA [Thermomicrobiales bacterium]|nr:preprotein translocase subunit SecA [Thermomicrobiales bacterium]
MRKLLGRLFADSGDRTLARLRGRAEEVNRLEPDFERLTDAELRDKTTEFKGRLLAGDTLDDLLPEAFAAVREAAKRALGQRHFDVQLIGGMVLHEGKIAEMKTGEGKTLVASLPLYLNSLAGQGCHLVTPNDYLSRLGGGWMGPVYHRLGVSVGVICHEFGGLYDPDYVDPAPHGDERLTHWRQVERHDAYGADITYGTNNEFGFDYLRDNMVVDIRQTVQRPLSYAIVDEVDNILIDEARTPLIISGPAEEATDRYYQFAQLVKNLRLARDFEIDEKRKVVTMTDEGIDHVERLLNLPEGASIYDDRYSDLTHYLDNALKAKAIYHLNKDYIIEADGEVVIVDEFTGRKMPGRRWSEGLHQAIEAKEGVRVRRENVTLATITFQNYFRMYDKLAGMTGTAETEAEEFATIYNLDVVPIPTNKPMVREDFPDQVYKTEDAKFRAVTNEIAEMHAQDRPVLVGTTSIETSERLSHELERAGIEHEVLNAKQHEREALIVARAGQPGAVTIATNMAGRGTDILLGPGVTGAGGLHIIGTERHESRRIDNQLRGRAGRQGDPGSSRFYVSLEDELMRRFGSDRVAGIMGRLGMEEDVPIEARIISKSIESAQTKVEGYNFDIRKHVVQYDDVMNKQREVIYRDRHTLIAGEDLKARILAMVEEEIRDTVARHWSEDSQEEPDYEGLGRELAQIFPLAEPPAKLGEYQRDALEDHLVDLADAAYARKEGQLGAETMRQVERLVWLNTIDQLWTEHLTAMDEMRQGIGLQAYGQKDPLVAYKTEGYLMFQGLLTNLRHDLTHRIFWVEIVRPPRPRLEETTTNRDGDEGEGKKRPKRATKGQKVGRNDPCPCGSGKKYKNCHGAPAGTGARAAR